MDPVPNIVSCSDNDLKHPITDTNDNSSFFLQQYNNKCLSVFTYYVE